MNKAMLWHSSRSREELRFRLWDGHSVVFDTQPGNTHILNDLATKLFLELLDGGKNLTDLELACCDDVPAVHSTRVTAGSVQDAVSHLSRIGLAERRAD